MNDKKLKTETFVSCTEYQILQKAKICTVNLRCTCCQNRMEKIKFVALRRKIPPLCA